MALRRCTLSRVTPIPMAYRPINGERSPSLYEHARCEVGKLVTRLLLEAFLAPTPNRGGFLAITVVGKLILGQSPKGRWG